MVEVVNTTVMDSIYSKRLLKIFKRKEFISLAVCVVAFLLGLPNLMQVCFCFSIIDLTIKVDSYVIFRVEYMFSPYWISTQRSCPSCFWHSLRWLQSVGYMVDGKLQPMLKI